MESGRKKLAVSLENLLTLIVSRYQGSKAGQVKELLESDDVLQAYFLVTQVSQDIANESKKACFLEVSKNIGSINNRVPCTDMAGQEGTERTGKWRALLARMVAWWTNPNDLLDRIKMYPTLIASLQMSRDGTVSDNWRYSRCPTEVGSYIHEAYGEMLAYGCAKMFGWEKNLSHIVPGRMIHIGIPFVGVTPDAVSIVNQQAFHRLTRKLFRGEAVTAKERAAGAPWMMFELKTLHGCLGVSDEEDSTVQDYEIDALYAQYQSDDDVQKEKTKEAALAVLVRKLELGKWMPSGLYAADDDFKLETSCYKMERSRTTKKQKSCTFFKRSTILYPTKQFEKLYAKRVGSKVYPNLAKLPTFKQKGDEPPTKKVKERQHGYQQVVKLKEMVKPGKAYMEVYRIGCNYKNVKLFRLDWEKAPLMLTLNCVHFNQVMGQHAVGMQYNEDVKSVFGLALRAKRSPATPFKTDPVQLAIVYAYDTGIQPLAIDNYGEVLVREIGLAAQGVAESKHLCDLFIDSDYASRKEMFYRRAYKLPRLMPPTHKVTQDTEDKEVWASDEEDSPETCHACLPTGEVITEDDDKTFLINTLMTTMEES